MNDRANEPPGTRPGDFRVGGWDDGAESASNCGPGIVPVEQHRLALLRAVRDRDSDGVTRGGGTSSGATGHGRYILARADRPHRQLIPTLHRDRRPFPPE